MRTARGRALACGAILSVAFAVVVNSCFLLHAPRSLLFAPCFLPLLFPFLLPFHLPLLDAVLHGQIFRSRIELRREVIFESSLARWIPVRFSEFALSRQTWARAVLIQNVLMSSIGYK